MFAGCMAVFVFFIGLINTNAQQVLPLYNGEIPNAIASSKNEQTDTAIDRVMYVSKPTLTVFLPPKKIANGAAVIICPGGGYGSLVIKREGYDVAEAFAKMGVAAFVLKYRLPDSSIMKDRATGPLQDAQQAIKMIREKAIAFNVDKNKIGIMGFSAGGHLAATAGTHFTKILVDNKDSVSVRPDFLILVYAVISFNDSLTHSGSKNNLLGAAPSEALVKEFSNELQVTKETPPAFLVHASDDAGVPAENSIRFYQALIKNGTAAELHIYARGGHGFLLYPSPNEWITRCKNWMKSIGLIKF